jgi:multiple antibiotic resistance protein
VNLVKQRSKQKRESDAQTRNDIACSISHSDACWTRIYLLLIAFYSEHQETSEIIISVVAMVAVAIAIFHRLAKRTLSS